jgi:hypothetical protein
MDGLEKKTIITGEEGPDRSVLELLVLFTVGHPLAASQYITHRKKHDIHSSGSDKKTPLGPESCRRPRQ